MILLRLLAAYGFAALVLPLPAVAQTTDASSAEFITCPDEEDLELRVTDEALLEEACWAEFSLEDFRQELEEQRTSPAYQELALRNEEVLARNKAGRAADPCYVPEEQMPYLFLDVSADTRERIARRRAEIYASCQRALATLADGTVDDDELRALEDDDRAYLMALDIRANRARQAGRFEDSRAARVAAIDRARAIGIPLDADLRIYSALLTDIGRYGEAAEAMQAAAREAKPRFGIDDHYLDFRIEAASAAVRAGLLSDAESILLETIPLIVGATFKIGGSARQSMNPFILFARGLDSLAAVRLAQSRPADAQRLLASVDWFYSDQILLPIGKLPHFLARVDTALALDDLTSAQAAAALLASLPEEEFTVSDIRAIRFAQARVALRAGEPEKVPPLIDGVCNETLSPAYADFATCAALRGQSTLLRDPTGKTALADGFVALQQISSPVAGDALARNAARAAAQLGGAAAIVAEYETTQRAIIAADQDLDRLFANAEADDERAEVRARRAALAERQAELAAELRARAPDYWEFRSPSPLALEELAGDTGLLAPNEALVMLCAPADGLAGSSFAVSRGGAAWAPVTMSADELDMSIRILRRQIDPSTDRSAPGAATYQSFDRKLAHRLYVELLGDPAIRRIVEDPQIDTLLLVVDGSVAALPPGLLVVEPPTGSDEDDDALRATPWLIRSKAIAILPTASSLRSLRTRAVAKAGSDNPLIAFADPDFRGTGLIPGLAATADPMAVSLTRSLAVPEAPTRGQVVVQGGTTRAQLAALPELYQTLKEGVALAKLLGAERDYLLLGPAASEARLMQLDGEGLLARTRVLAFSTHGLISGDFVGLNEPALALAAPDPGAAPYHDGFLLASEAATLNLSAEWVVLSACNTAAADRAGGEGLSGLARSFLYAGAERLLVSHWQVRDDATRALISTTFETFSRQPELGRAKALQRAMLDLMDDTIDDGSRLIVGNCDRIGVRGREDCPMATLAHPWAWAPFVLVGLP